MPYKVGDNVEIEWSGRIVQGKVLGIDAHGWVKVKFDDNGKERTLTLPAEHVQPIKKGGAKKDAPRRKGELRPGDEVEFDWMGETRRGKVFSISPNSGWVTVRFDYEGHERTTTCPPDDVWPVKKKTPVDKEKKSAKEPAKDPVKEPAKEKEPARQPKSDDGEMRTWTDSTGKYKTEASFLALKEGKVRLKKADGSILALPLEKLSEADQWIAKRLAKDQADDNPFVLDEPAGKEGGKKTDAAQKPDAAEKPDEPGEEAAELASGDWSQVRTVVIDTSANGEIAPDAAQEVKHGRLRPFAVRSGGNPELIDNILPDRAHLRLLLAFISRGTDVELRLQVCDLRTAKAVHSLTLNTSAAAVDLSPDGTQLVCVPRRFDRRKNRPEAVEVWKLEKDGALVNRWNANEGERKGVTPDCAGFISPEQVLTYNSGSGTLTLWEVKNARAIYTLNASPGCPPMLSANRKQLAVMSVAGPAILDAASGETLAALPGGPASECRFAFRPDGRKLAALFGEKVCLWDLAEKKLDREIWLPQSLPVNLGWFMGESRLDWIGDEHVLANGSHLINTRKRVVLWQYRAAGQIKSCIVDDKLCYVMADLMGAALSMGRRGAGARRSSNVILVDLPHPEAVKVAAGLSEENLQAVKPGTEVSLNVSIPSLKPDELKQVVSSLSQRLKANGVSVVTGAPITLEAAVEAGKTETQTYHVIGRGGEETVSATQQIFRLSFKENGRTLWERKNVTGGTPMMIFAQEGESLQDSVNKQRTSPLRFFLDTTLPQYVTRYPADGAYGASLLTLNGLAPAKSDGSQPMR